MSANDKIGLVLVSHGSPSQPWNDTMNRVTNAVRARLSEHRTQVFAQVELAHLEFVKPDIADVCESLESQNCTRIVAFPLFISVSSHSERDIPNALNIRYHDHSDPEIRRYIGNVPITYTCPLDHGPILPIAVSACASEISVHPEAESVLILSHGGGCEHFWEHIHRRVAQKVTDLVGIRKVSWLTVQTGRSPASQDSFVEKVKEMTEEDANNKILILSCFAGLSGTQFIERISQGLARRNKDSLDSLFKDKLVGCFGWIEKPAVVQEIVNVVSRAAEVAVHGKPTDTTTCSKDAYPPYNPPFRT